jgi:hypothetical protein
VTHEIVKELEFKAAQVGFGSISTFLHGRIRSNAAPRDTLRTLIGLLLDLRPLPRKPQPKTVGAKAKRIITFLVTSAERVLLSPGSACPTGYVRL